MSGDARRNDYKKTLGDFLALGATRNYFGYPQEGWPPPTPARRYIGQFLDKYTHAVHGSVVEFYPAVYRGLFPAATSYDVWNVVSADGATVIADLQSADAIDDNSYDAIICTHVLSAIRNVWKATEELYRILKPGGLLLVTVPCLLQAYAPDPADYWRFTTDSLGAVLERFTMIEMVTYGNAAVCAGSFYYLMDYDFPERVVDDHDQGCPSIVCAAVTKE